MRVPESLVPLFDYGVLEDVVRPLLGLPVLSLGVVEVRGLFGATLAWARLRPDAPAWLEP